MEYVLHGRGDRDSWSLAHTTCLKPFHPHTTKVSDLAFSSLIMLQHILMNSVKNIYMVSQKR